MGNGFENILCVWVCSLNNEIEFSQQIDFLVVAAGFFLILFYFTMESDKLMRAFLFIIKVLGRMKG